MKRFLLAVVCVMCLAGAASMVGCETVSGMGKDLNNAGTAIFGPSQSQTQTNSK